jgi:hypothetical protein
MKINPTFIANTPTIKSNIKASDIASFPYSVDLNKDTVESICKKDEKYHKGKAFCLGFAGFFLSYTSNNKVSKLLKTYKEAIKKGIEKELTPENLKPLQSKFLKTKAKYIATCLGIGSAVAIIPYGIYKLWGQKNRTEEIKFVKDLNTQLSKF